MKETLDLSLADPADAVTIIKIMQSVFVDALNQNATEIHILGQEDLTWQIKYRSNGVLKNSEFHLALEFGEALINQIQIRAGKNQSTEPQTGTIHLHVDGNNYTMGMSTNPTLKTLILEIKKDE